MVARPLIPLMAGGLALLLSVIGAEARLIHPNSPEGLEQRKRELALWNKKLEQKEKDIRQRERQLGLVKKSAATSSSSSPSTSSSSSEGPEVLVFEETFDTFDLDLWQHELTLGGGGNWEFQLYANNRTNSYVEDNVLFLQPTLTSDTYGMDRVTGETPFRLDFWGSSPADQCSGAQFYGCERQSDATVNRILNPIQSARVRTAGTFSFKYGRLEVEAKLPKGDWLWPAIWLLPEKNAYGNWPASGEIDLMESRGNAPGYIKGGHDTMSSCLHWAPYFELDAFAKTYGEFKLPKGQSFNDDFHTFGLVWNEDGMFTYVDSEENKVLAIDFKKESFWARGEFEKLNIKSPWQGRSNAAPFDQPFYLIFNVAVGGLSNFFPDGAGKKPWTNHDTDAASKFLLAKDKWHTTWQDKQSALQIRSVRVWQDSKPLATGVTDMRGHYASSPLATHPTSDDDDDMSNLSLMKGLLAAGAFLGVLVGALVILRGRPLRSYYDTIRV